MTIFQVLLIGGPLFFIAGILVLKFRNTASKRATSAQRSVDGYGRFGDNQVRVPHQPKSGPSVRSGSSGEQSRRSSPSYTY